MQLAYDFIVAFSFAAFSCLLSALKLFKFLSINKRMNTLWLTLQVGSARRRLSGSTDQPMTWLTCSGYWCAVVPVCRAQAAMYDLVMFGAGFAFIISGFGLAGYFLFGHALPEFHTIPSSISTLTRFVLSTCRGPAAPPPPHLPAK